MLREISVGGINSEAFTGRVVDGVFWKRDSVDFVTMLDPFATAGGDLWFIDTNEKSKVTFTSWPWKNGVCLPLGFSWILVQDLRHSLEVKTILEWQPFPESQESSPLA